MAPPGAKTSLSPLSTLFSLSAALHQVLSPIRILLAFVSRVAAARFNHCLAFFISMCKFNALVIHVLFADMRRYLVTNLMQTDLRTVMNLKSIDHEFVQFFLYEIMNILINDNCDLNICDFGLARVYEPQMTGYVSTRYYRAPEIMLAWQRYGEQVDIWSAGCIFAKMLQGKPLFTGRHQWISSVPLQSYLVTPNEEIRARVASEIALNFLQSLPQREATGVSSVSSVVEPKGMFILQCSTSQQMLIFNPYGQISASGALTAPYLVSCHEPTDEPVARELFYETFDGDHGSDDSWKQKLHNIKQPEGRESVRKWAWNTLMAEN
ncbi:hypothetical protein N7489_004745 [Penicillium chrysogenum]|nr:uncharacterized protein N7489_004745 [Penicillium chrysogenum]KAJ5244649.1 hypothetical protein N7489_004745 [Penicillium chrysogenum]